MLFTDGIFALQPEELESLAKVVKTKALRIFCVGCGPAAYRSCLRLSAVGQGSLLMTDSAETEKSLSVGIASLLEDLLQPPTVMNKLDLKVCCASTSVYSRAPTSLRSY